ncbi:uncharacterized protein [Halyomorpha halys]|uniref:uncharacterized protein n=1 Tax=Halyomorpha halys TaxID=286706 RepID=UPI0006D500FD|nr:uncharacterized protein LOC106687634 [Halyomorpha halys]
MASRLSFCLLLVVVASAAGAEDGWATVGRFWRQCKTEEDATGCLGRQVVSLERSDIDLGGGLVLKRAEERSGRAIEGDDIYSRIARLFSGRSLQLNLPNFTGRELEQGVDEGRGKMKKMMGSMMMMGAMKAMMVIPMMLGTLFLLAGKAFVIAKIALVLALIVTLKKLVASKQESHGGWSGGGGGWDRRSLDSHDLAYAAYATH